MSDNHDISRTFDAPADVDRIARWGMIAAVVGIGLSILGFLVDRGQFFRSYLVSYNFWLSISLGCFAVGMLHQLSRGGWGMVIRRVLGAASRTLPLMFVLFVPMLFGLTELYSWARPEEVAASKLLQHKEPYLNTTFFIARWVFYFVCWIGVAWLLNRASRKQDDTANPKLVRRLQIVSAPGLGLYCLTATFASFDWLMSLDPTWYSTIYGVYYVASHGLSAFAFFILAALWLSQREPMKGIFTARHFHDYGKLMLAFVMLWAYFSFSQFLIIWSANLPSEISFYLKRLSGGWQVVALALVIAHFALPFVLLLSRSLKRHGKRLVWVALLVLAMRWVDLHWQVAPVFEDGLTVSWQDLATMLAVGGLWTVIFIRQLKNRPLLPVGDPDLEEALGIDPHQDGKVEEALSHG